MKNKIIFISIAMAISLSLFAGTVTTSGKIGRTSKGCAGLGVCKTQTTTSLITLNWEYITGSSSIKLHINKLELSQKQPTAVAEFLNKTSVTFEEETEIPATVVTTFNLQSNIIASGTYPLLETTDEYIVVFQL
jgi:hypothetical protein